MYTNSILAVSGALLSVVAAVPMAGEHARHHQHHQRDYVWETATEEVVVTVPVTKTVWIEPGETAPSHGQKHHGYGKPSSSDVEPAAYTPASSSSAPAAPAYVPSSSSSAPAAPAYTPESSSSIPEAPAYTPPTSTSTSVYVAPTPTSTYVAPTSSTSTSVYVAPTPTSTYVAPAPTTYAAPSSSSAAAAPSYSSGGSDSGSSGSNGLSGIAASGTEYSGDLTWYQVGMGACGWTNTQDEPIVAISEKIFDTYSTGNPNTNPLCGKYVTITGKDGSPYKAKIVDRCPGCAEADLDLSQDFFNKCTENGDGRVSNMKWTFD